MNVFYYTFLGGRRTIRYSKELIELIEVNRSSNFSNFFKIYFDAEDLYVNREISTESFLVHPIPIYN